MSARMQKAKASAEGRLARTARDLNVDGPNLPVAVGIGRPIDTAQYALPEWRKLKRAFVRRRFRMAQRAKELYRPFPPPVRVRNRRGVKHPGRMHCHRRLDLHGLMFGSGKRP